MIKAVVFDCFGVFVGNPYKERVAILDKENPKLAEQVRALNRATDRGLLSREESLVEMADTLGMAPEVLAREQDEGEVLNERLVEYAKSLKGRYKLALLSNVSGRERLENRFRPHKLDDLFEVVVASGDEGFIKPEPEIYEITSSRLGVDPSECLMVDDIEEFCAGAVSAGMQAIQFLSTDQAMADISLLLDRGGEKV